MLLRNYHSFFTILYESNVNTSGVILGGGQGGPGDPALPVLSSQVMKKVYVASFAESSINTNFQTIGLIFHYNTFSNLSASIFRNIKLFQIVQTLGS